MGEISAINISFSPSGGKDGQSLLKQPLETQLRNQTSINFLQSDSKITLFIWRFLTMMTASSKALSSASKANRARHGLADPVRTLPPESLKTTARWASSFDSEKAASVIALNQPSGGKFHSEPLFVLSVGGTVWLIWFLL